MYIFYEKDKLLTSGFDTSTVVPIKQKDLKIKLILKDIGNFII